MHNATETPLRFFGLSYMAAVTRVLQDPASSRVLKTRLAEDEQRDPVDALNDAEVLAEIQTLRQAAMRSVYQAALPEAVAAMKSIRESLGLPPAAYLD